MFLRVTIDKSKIENDDEVSDDEDSDEKQPMSIFQAQGNQIFIGAFI